jgi:hypothetical protein
MMLVCRMGSIPPLKTIEAFRAVGRPRRRTGSRITVLWAGACFDALAANSVLQSIDRDHDVRPFEDLDPAVKKPHVRPGLKVFGGSAGYSSAGRGGPTQKTKIGLEAGIPFDWTRPVIKPACKVCGARACRMISPIIGARQLYNGRLKLFGLPDWDWHDISANLRCSKCYCRFSRYSGRLDRADQFQQGYLLAGDGNNSGTDGSKDGASNGVFAKRTYSTVHRANVAADSSTARTPRRALSCSCAAAPVGTLQVHPKAQIHSVSVRWHHHGG